MKTFEYVIKDEIGIHARPAGNLAKMCKSFSSKVTLEANGKKAEATKLMSVMGMGIKKDTKVTVSVEGEDEVSAVVEVEKFFNDNL